MNMKSAVECWNEFCNTVNNFNYSNEAQYELVLTTLFRTLFGWETSNQETFHLGNHNAVRLDIALKRDDKIDIVVEVKTHDADPRNEQVAQLGSYLMLTKVRFGLLIGKKISIVYNDVRGIEEPIRLLDIEMTPDNKDGVRLVDAILCSKFGHGEKLEAYCTELIRRLNIRTQANDLVKLLVSEDGRAVVLDALKNSSLAGTYNVRAIELACERINVVENATPHVIEHVDTDKDTTVKSKSKQTNFEMLNIPIGSAIECIINNQIYTVKNGVNKIADINGNQTTPSHVASDLIGRPANGYEYFTYGGRKLTDIRREIDDTYLAPKTNEE